VYKGQLWVTVAGVLGAVAIASVLGLTLGYFIGRSRYAVVVFEPLLAGIFAVPIIIFLPVFILFFGIDIQSKIAFGATYAELGLSMALMSATTAVVQTPIGFLVDRYGARRFLVGGTLLMTLSIAGMGLATAYWQIVLLAMLSGLGNSVIHPADYAILSGSVDRAKLGRSFAFHSFVGHVEFAAAPPAAEKPVGLFEKNGVRLSATGVNVSENRSVSFIANGPAWDNANTVVSLQCRLATGDGETIAGIENASAKDDRGNLLARSRADLLLFDRQLDLKAVFIDGQEIQ